MPRVLALLIAGLLASTAASQATEPERQPVAGRVSTRSGEPWARARVTLLSLPYPADPTVGEPDRVDVVANEAGRFEAKLLPGRAYDAWALGELDGGRFEASGIAPGVLAGHEVELAGLETQRQVTLKLGRVDAWRRAGPLRVVVTSLAVGHRHRLRATLGIEADDSAVLPPMPGGRCQVEVEAANGFPIATTEVTLAENARSDAVETVRLPGVFWLLARVVSSGDEKPVSGAVLQSAHDLRLRPVGESDDDGYAELPLVQARDNEREFWLQLVVAAGDRRETYVGKWVRVGDQRAQRAVEPFVDVLVSRKISELRESGAADLVIELAEGETIRGRLLLDDGVPAAGVPLLYGTPEPDGGTALPARRLVTGSDGRFAIRGCAPGTSFRLLGVLSPRQLVQVTKDPAHPVAWLRSGSVPADGGLDLGDIELDELATADLTVFVADEAAVGQPGLIVADPDARAPGPAELGKLVPDVVRLLLPKDERRPSALARMGFDIAAASFEGLDPLTQALPRDAATRKGDVVGRGAVVFDKDDPARPTEIPTYADFDFPNPTEHGSPRLLARVYFPMSKAPPGGYPVLVFLHGYAKLGHEYPGLGISFASRGYVAVLLDTARYDVVAEGYDGIAMFTALEREDARAESPLAGKLDMSRAAIAGHSWGGANVNRVLADNPGYLAGGCFAPHIIPPQFSAKVAVPLVIVVGQGDKVTPWQTHAVYNYDAATADKPLKVMHVLDETCNHGNVADYTFLGAGPSDRAIFERCARVVGEMFDRYVLGDESALDHVVGTQASYTVLVEKRIAVGTPEAVKTGSELGGETAFVHVLGEPGFAALLFSYERAKLETPFGVLQLEPAFLLVPKMTLLERTGITTHVLPLPPDAQLENLELHFQALAMARQRLRLGSTVTIKIGRK